MCQKEIFGLTGVHVDQGQILALFATIGEKAFLGFAP